MITYVCNYIYFDGNGRYNYHERISKGTLGECMKSAFKEIEQLDDNYLIKSLRIDYDDWDRQFETCDHSIYNPSRTDDRWLKWIFHETAFELSYRKPKLYPKSCRIPDPSATLLQTHI